MSRWLAAVLLLGVVIVAGWWLMDADPLEESAEPATTETGRERTTTRPDRAAGQENKATAAAAPTADTTPAAPASALTDEEGEEGDPVLAAFRERGCIDNKLMRAQQLSPIRQRELEAWLETQGHFGGLNANPSMMMAAFGDYGSYETGTLRSLAKDDNDRKAQLALANRLLQEGKHDEAAEWYRESVINGYTVPLFALSMQHSMHTTLGLGEAEDDMDSDQKEEAMREAMLESMAYLSFARQRGAPMADAMLSMIKRMGDRIPGGQEFMLGEDDWEAVEERGQALYDDYEAERLERDQPPFDNSRPEMAELLDRDAQSLIDAVMEGLQPCNMPVPAARGG